MPEQNVGMRLLVIGKTAAVAAVREFQAAQASLNKTILDGAAASKEAALSQDAFYAKGSKSLAQYNAEQKAAQEAQLASVASFGKRATFALGAAAAVVTYAGVKYFGQYETALKRLHTQAGLTVAGMNAVGQAALRIAPALGATPESFLNAAYHPASSGFNARDVIAITAAAQKESMISGANLDDTTYGLSSVMKTYGLHARQATPTQALLNAIVGSGDMRYQDFNGALSTGLFQAGRTFGMSMQSQGAALAYMTDRGVPAQEAATRLRMTEALLGAPTQRASKYLSAIGLSSNEITARTQATSQMLQAAGLSTTQLSKDLAAPNGFLMAINDLRTHMQAAGMSPQEQAALLTRSFGGGRSSSALLALYNSPGQLGQKYGQIGAMAGVGTFNKDFTTAMSTQQAKLKQLDAAWHAFAITVGKTVTPAIKTFLDIGSGVLNFFAKNTWAVGVLGTAITGVLVPAIAVYLKRALLGSGTAIGSVIKFYATLVRTILFGAVPAEAAETAALSREDAALTGNDAALARNIQLQRSLSRSTFVGGGLAGAGGGSATAALGARNLMFGGSARVLGGGAGVALDEAGMPIAGAAEAGSEGALGLASLAYLNPVGLGLATIFAIIGGGKAKWAGHKLSGVGAPTQSSWEAQLAHLDPKRAAAEIAQIKGAEGSGAFSQWVMAHNAQLAAQPHVTVMIDGKAVFEAVATQTRKKAARQ